MPTADSRLRLTFLITDLHRGGSPLLLADLAPGLAQCHGFDIRVVSIAAPGEVAGLIESRGVPVLSLNAASNHDPRILPRFVRHLRDFQPQIVCSILIHANLLATLAKPFAPLPSVWVQSLHTLQERPRWHWYLQGLLCAGAEAFIAPSQAVIDKLQAYGAVPQPRVIPNGIDVERFHDAEPISPERLPWNRADSFVVGYIGRFDPVKRLPLLLEATRILLERQPARRGVLHVALVGYGPQAQHLRQMVLRNALATTVHILPPTSQPEGWYKVFDVFCSPSAAEGFGLTLAEATVAGIPVIACGTRAVRETLPGALWLSQNPAAIEVAHAIEKAMSHPPPSGLALAALQRKYSLQTMIDRYARGFVHVLQGFSPR